MRVSASFELLKQNGCREVVVYCRRNVVFATIPNNLRYLLKLSTRRYVDMSGSRAASAMRVPESAAAGSRCSKAQALALPRQRRIWDDQLRASTTRPRSKGHYLSCSTGGYLGRISISLCKRQWRNASDRGYRLGGLAAASRSQTEPAASKSQSREAVALISLPDELLDLGHI